MVTTELSIILPLDLQDVVHDVGHDDFRSLDVGDVVDDRWTFVKARRIPERSSILRLDCQKSIVVLSGAGFVEIEEPDWAYPCPRDRDEAWKPVCGRGSQAGIVNLPPPTTTVMSPPVASASSESGASTSTVTETASEKEPPVEDTALQEPSVQRPPLPAPPAFQYHQQCIEEVAEDLRGLHKRHSSASSSSTSSSSRPLPPAPPKTGKPRAPSPPLPPPPPQEEAEVAADFPLPPPPLLEVEEDAQSTTSSTHSAPSSPSKPSPPQLAYHRDSYMVHRKERKLMGIPGGVSENGRYLRRHISPASHTVPPNQGAAEHQISDPGMKGSTTWDTRVLHGRQHSTTVNFTTAEVAALKEQRERAALLRSRSHAASLQPHSPPPKLPEKPLSLLSPPSSKSIGSLNVLSLPPPSEPSRDSPAPSLTSSSSYSNLGSLSRSSDCGSLPSSADSACYSSVGNLSSLLPRVSSSDTGLLLSAASSSVSLAFRDLRSTAKNSSSSGISSPVSSLSSPYHSRDNSTDDKVVEPSSVTPPFHPASRGTLLRPRSPPAPLVIEYRRRPRFPIEESCENAAKDFLPSLLATVKDRQREERLASILGPPSDIRSASDYLEGIFCRDCDEGRAILDKKLGASSSKSERGTTLSKPSWCLEHLVVDSVRRPFEHLFGGHGLCREVEQQHSRSTGAGCARAVFWFTSASRSDWMAAAENFHSLSKKTGPISFPTKKEKKLDTEGSGVSMDGMLDWFSPSIRRRGISISSGCGNLRPCPQRRKEPNLGWLNGAVLKVSAVVLNAIERKKAVQSGS
ncbi:unnamed protein product [Cyprideis torosa]|uniref:Uncharacterized protein n=1 Tax=Cyprideis torosa TaxID=163714 RepID=A0A7R8W8E3_9CRUS|nr:unnamed protein product [Cyprideis torosa]CAG0883397.1 unnamed protein product [Cyprideis torosa]